jgi:hypothetical protein
MLGEWGGEIFSPRLCLERFWGWIFVWLARHLGQKYRSFLPQNAYFHFVGYREAGKNRQVRPVTWPFPESGLFTDFVKLFSKCFYARYVGTRREAVIQPYFCAIVNRLLKNNWKISGRFRRICSKSDENVLPNCFVLTDKFHRKLLHLGWAFL